mgnify:CR=1 FL=1
MKHITKSILILALFIIFFAKDSTKLSYLDELTLKYQFDIFSWELQNLPKKTINVFKNNNLTESEVKTILEIGNESNDSQIELYFEKTVSNEIKDKLEKNFLFPPLYLSLEKPPKVLIISPRNKIFQKKALLIDNAIPLKEIIIIENAIDEKNLSSIILDTGGFAAYPSIVKKNKDYDFMISTVSHEWLHQYLFFYPLGRSYFKGGEMVSINETLADLFGQEISKKNIKSYNSEDFFYSFMRETRLEVDELLRLGKIFEAEKYMLDQTNVLKSKGYKIRKINQAYFAFYGNYGSSPSSTHSFDLKLEELMNSYESFGDFLDEVKMIDHVDKFENLINLRASQKK